MIDLSRTPIYRFNDIEIDVAQGCVRRAGQAIYLRQQTFQVLLYLLRWRERLVTKEELFENIWKDAAVTDNALLQCIFDIRKTLGDDSRNPRFIKTFPKVGYRFISPVEEVYPPEEQGNRGTGEQGNRGTGEEGNRGNRSPGASHNFFTSSARFSSPNRRGSPDFGGFGSHLFSPKNAACQSDSC